MSVMNSCTCIQESLNCSHLYTAYYWYSRHESTLQWLETTANSIVSQTLFPSTFTNPLYGLHRSFLRTAFLYGFCMQTLFALISSGTGNGGWIASTALVKPRWWHTKPTLQMSQQETLLTINSELPNNVSIFFRLHFSLLQKTTKKAT